jgi:hypothetical protein
MLLQLVEQVNFSTRTTEKKTLTPLASISPVLPNPELKLSLLVYQIMMCQPLLRGS